MKKQLIIVSILFVLILMGCNMTNNVGDEVYQYNDLANETEAETEIETSQEQTIYYLETMIFNTLEVEGSMNLSFDSNDFFLPLAEEQLNEIFPFLESADAEHIRGRAEYQRDGTLVEMRFAMNFPDESIYRFEILVGFGRPPRSFHEYGFFDDEIFEYSKVHGVSVRALIVDAAWPSDDWKSFDATFVIDDVYYRVRFRDDEERGKNRMTEVVNKLIFQGTERFAILENPDIPYMREEDITFENAQLDPEFGAFVPLVIPDELTFYWGNRMIQEHLDENSLSLTWKIDYDEQYLYDLYTQWVNQRTVDTPVFPFEDIHWGTNEFSWRISQFQERDLGYLISATDFMQDDSLLDAWEPIFISDELTFEIIERIERIANPYAFPDGAYSEPDLDLTDILIPYARNWFRFGILFDDILITIYARRNSTPEMLWSMLEGLLD